MGDGAEPGAPPEEAERVTGWLQVGCGLLVPAWLVGTLLFRKLVPGFGSGSVALDDETTLVYELVGPLAWVLSGTVVGMALLFVGSMGALTNVLAGRLERRRASSERAARLEQTAAALCEPHVQIRVWSSRDPEPTPDSGPGWVEGGEPESTDTTGTDGGPPPPEQGSR